MNAAPSRLYIALDGPRTGVASDEDNVSRVRQLCAEVPWSCQVRTLIRETNLGCKKAVSSAIDWFFANETEGIILEDDCLPNSSFFDFCELMLDRYRNDDRVWCITGANFQGGINRGSGSYYFSKYPHIWGWATWKRCWDAYNVDIPLWPQWKKSKHLKTLFPDIVERRHWENIFDSVYTGKIDTWDFQWLAAVWMNDGLTATPQVNLVTNIGFGVEATHTKQSNSRRSIPSETLGNTIVDPQGEMCANEEADRYVFETIFARTATNSMIIAKRIKDGLRRVSELAPARFYRRLRRA